MNYGLRIRAFYATFDEKPDVHQLWVQSFWKCSRWNEEILRLLRNTIITRWRFGDSYSDVLVSEESSRFFFFSISVSDTYDCPKTSKSTSVQMRNSIFVTMLNEIKAAVSVFFFFLKPNASPHIAPASFKTSSQRSSVTWWGLITPNQSRHSMEKKKKQDMWLICTMLNEIKTEF